MVQEIQGIVELLPGSVILKDQAKQIASIFAAAGTKDICSEKDLQTYLDKALGQNKLLFPQDIEYRSTCNQPTFGNLKPDILFVKSSRPSYAEQCVFLAELKFKYSKKQGQIIVAENFADEDKQQVVNYNEFLLDKQKHRPSVVSLLCNSEWALLIKSCQGSAENLPSHYVSGTFKLNSDEGTDIISRLFSMTMEDHGFCLPEIPGYLVSSVLGVGSFSVVYEVEKEGQKFAAKVYNIAADCQAEYNVLCKLAEINNIPKVVERVVGATGSCSWETLVLSTIAHPVVSPGFTPEHSLTLRDIHDTIDVLEGAHKLKIIHRDIRAPNLLLCHGSGVLVSDWGCALMDQDGSKV